MINFLEGRHLVRNVEEAWSADASIFHPALRPASAAPVAAAALDTAPGALYEDLQINFSNTSEPDNQLTLRGDDFSLEADLQRVSDAAYGKFRKGAEHVLLVTSTKPLADFEVYRAIPSLLPAGLLVVSRDNMPVFLGSALIHLNFTRAFAPAAAPASRKRTKQQTGSPSAARKKTSEQKDGLNRKNKKSGQ
jgi:hypothetical protein